MKRAKEEMHMKSTPKEFRFYFEWKIILILKKYFVVNFRVF